MGEDPSDLWKLEYGKSADRYNEIYKAVWQNFSYMAILSGGFFTFGKEALGVVPAALIACAPLLVWYWATYEPLHKYGVLVEERLVDLEGQLTDASEEAPRLYTKLFRLRFGKQKALEAVRPSPAFLGFFALVCLGGLAVGGLFGLVAGGQYLPWYPIAAALVAASILFYLVQQWRLRKLRVETSMRIWALLLHGSFFFLLGSWISGARPPTDRLARLHLENGDLAIDFRGQPTQLKSALQALLADPMFQSVSGVPEVLQRAVGPKDSGAGANPRVREDRGK